MLTFVLRRFASMLLVLFCVVSATFFLMRSAPGGPFDRERELMPQAKHALEVKFHYDGTPWQQYTAYMGRLLHGDLGPSTRYRNRTVNELLAQTLPVSAALGAVAFVLATVGGVMLGGWAAARRGTPGETGAMLASLLAISVPTFVTGPLLILVFALHLGWLPVGGWGSPTSWILPALTLAGPYVAYIARLTRTSMLEVLGQDYIRTARAKGLAEWKVVSQHAAKVAILPVVSFLGPLAANLLTGSIVIETIFNIPGAGGFFVNSILNNDGFLLEGVTIVYCVLLMGLNLLVDIAYPWLDRRIKSHE